MFIVAVLGYLFYKMLERLINSIQEQLQYVKWVEDKHEPFRAKYGYGHEWVFALPVIQPDPKNKEFAPSEFQQKYSHQRLVDILASAGFETRMHFNLTRDVVFVKVRLSLEQFMLFADTIDYKVKLNPVRLRSILEKGRKIPGTEEQAPVWKWLPLSLVDPHRLCSYEHTEAIFGKYDESEELQEVYKQSTGTVFRNIDRLKLILAKLEAPEDIGGCNLPLRRMVNQKAIIASFPLHEYRELTELKRQWLLLFQAPQSQPFELIKDYFGEKIGLYFVWLGLYTHWLIYASIIGGLCWLDVAFEGGNYNAPGTIVFALFMAFWSTLYLESWKNKQARTSKGWGMVGYEEEELERVEFGNHPDVEPIPDPVGSRFYRPEDVKDPRKAGTVRHDSLYFPATSKALLAAQSQTVIATMVLGVLGVVMGIFFLKLDFANGSDEEGNCDYEPNSGCTGVTVPEGRGLLSGMNLGGTMVSVLNAVSIQVMGMIFNTTARFLNDRENHRTETEYEDSLIVKSFFFSFINSYASLFFTAFVVLLMPRETRIQFCPEDECMTALSTTLTTLFIVRLTSGNLTEVVIPYFQQQKKLKEVEQRSKDGLSKVEVWMSDSMTAVEEQFLMKHYDILHDMFADYLEMVIQFGYATLFSAAFLFAPLLAFINNYVEIRVDAWKITTLCQRPHPKAAEDIGSWLGVMEIMSSTAVVTNVALICFTSHIMEDLSSAQRFIVFAVLEHVILGLKFVLEISIDDVPEDVKIQGRRQEAYVDRVINGKEDDSLEILEFIKAHPDELEEARKYKNISSASEGGASDGILDQGLRVEPVPVLLDIHATDFEFVRSDETLEAIRLYSTSPSDRPSGVELGLSITGDEDLRNQV